MKHISTGNYEQNVILSAKPVVLNLRADWCSQCDDTEALLLELEEEYDDIITVMELNVQLNPELSEIMEIKSLPMIAMMTGGVIVKKIYGIPTKEDLIETLELETIREFKARGINYHPKRNYIPDYIRNEF